MIQYHISLINANWSEFFSCRHSICLISSMTFRGGYVHNIMRMMSISSHRFKLHSSFLFRKELGVLFQLIIMMSTIFQEHMLCEANKCLRRKVCSPYQLYLMLHNYFRWSYLETTGNIIILYVLKFQVIYSLSQMHIWRTLQVDYCWHIYLYIALCSDPSTLYAIANSCAINDLV